MAFQRVGRRGVVMGGLVKDALEFRQVMGSFPTGVTVVAARDEGGEPVGLTVNSFASVSLEPPLVLVCVERTASSHDRLTAAGSFAVSVLSAEQEALAHRFASEAPEERFRDLAWFESPTGDPVVENAAAWLACSLEVVHPGGDHSILVGRVRALGTGSVEALVFYRGAYGKVAT